MVYCLVEDIFFKPFMEALQRATTDLKPFKGNFNDVYHSYWHTFNGVGRVPESFAVADGSNSSTTFRGGLRAVCMRAVVNVYHSGNLKDTIPSVDVKVGQKLRCGAFYMKALEFRGLANVLGKCKVAMCDGDLYPTLHPAIVWHEQQEVKAYLEYLNAFYSLYSEAYKRGTLLLGVVKDSTTNYVRAKIIAQYILAKRPELVRDLSRVRSPQKITWLIKGAEVDPACEGEAETPTSDEEVFDECAPEPGFTTPMLLAPQPIFLNEEVKAGTSSWLNSRIRQRLIDKGPPLSEVADTLDRIYSLPPIVMFYWRPWHGIGVYRVDVAGWVFGRDGKWNDLSNDAFLGEGVSVAEEVAAMLNALSPEPFTVKPLFDVDYVVRIDSGVYKDCYLPIIVDALRNVGLKAVMTKRDLREMIR